MKAESLVTSIEVAPRGGWLAQVARMIGWNLYQMRRRAMSKWLSIIFALPLVVMVGIFLATGKHDLLAYPTLFRLFGSVLSSLGPLLLPILAATLIGSEYTYGIQRQLLGRGMSRLQVYTGQLAALAVVTLLGTAITLLLGIILSLLFGNIFGVQMALPPGGAWLGLLTYWLGHSLNIYFFVTIAVFVSTLGRNPIAGTAVALGYQIFETLVRSILVVLVSLFDQNTAKNLIHFQEWLPGVVAQTMLSGPSSQIFQEPTNSTNNPDVMSPTMALIVLIVYLLILIIGGYFLYSRRDMTE